MYTFQSANEGNVALVSVCLCNGIDTEYTLC